MGASGVAFVGQGPTLSAYSPSGKRFWTYNAATAGGDTPPNINTPALSASGSTVYALNITFNLFTPALVEPDRAQRLERRAALVGAGRPPGHGPGYPRAHRHHRPRRVAVCGRQHRRRRDRARRQPRADHERDRDRLHALRRRELVYRRLGSGVGRPGAGSQTATSTCGRRRANGGEVVALSRVGRLLWSTALGSQSAAGYLGTAPLVSPSGSTIYVATRAPTAPCTRWARATEPCRDHRLGPHQGHAGLVPRTGSSTPARPRGLVRPAQRRRRHGLSPRARRRVGTLQRAGHRGRRHRLRRRRNTLVAVSGTTGTTKWSFTAPIPGPSSAARRSARAATSTSRPTRWARGRRSSTRSRVRPEPFEHRLSVAPGREDRVATRSMRPPRARKVSRLYSRTPPATKVGSPTRTPARTRVVQQRIRHPLPHDERPLLGERLRAHPVHHRTEVRESSGVLPEHAVLNRAPPSTRNVIPAFGKSLPRLPVIGGRHRRPKAPKRPREVDIGARSRGQHDRGDEGPDEVIGAAIVRRNRKVRREGVQTVVRQSEGPERGRARLCRCFRSRLGASGKDAGVKRCSAPRTPRTPPEASRRQRKHPAASYSPGPLRAKYHRR